MDTAKLDVTIHVLILLKQKKIGGIEFKILNHILHQKAIKLDLRTAMIIGV
jgi:hypothetical protein